MPFWAEAVIFNHFCVGVACVRFIYKVSATFFTDASRSKTFDSDIAYWESYEAAQKSLLEWAHKDLHYEVYCFSILKQPLADDAEFHCMTEQFLYTPKGELWSHEFGMVERRVLASREHNFCVYVYPDQSDKNHQYFKIFDNEHALLSSRCALVMLSSAEYGICKSYGKSPWFLTKEEKEILYSFLKANDEACYKKICRAYCEEQDLLLTERLMPDYRLL